MSHKLVEFSFGTLRKRESNFGKGAIKATTLKKAGISFSPYFPIKGSNSHNLVIMRVILAIFAIVLACEAKIYPINVPVPIPVPELDIKHIEKKISPVKEVKVPVIKRVPVENVIEHTKDVEVIKHVPVENEVKVFRDVEVVREVPVERIIHKRVEVPVEVIREVELIREVPVIKEIPHVKVVKVVKEVPVEEIVYKDVYEPVTHPVKIPIHVPVITEDVKEHPSKFGHLLNFKKFLG